MNIKYLNEQIKDIVALNDEMGCQINDNQGQFTDKSASLVKRDRGYALKTTGSKYNMHDSWTQFNITVKTDIFDLVLERVSLTTSSPNPEGVLLQTFSVDSFSTIGFDKAKAYYYRQLIPLPESLYWHHAIDDTRVSVNGHSINPRLTLRVSNMHFDVYTYNYNQSNYLIVDALTQLGLNQFKQYCYSILLSLGWITGYFPQDNGYLFAFETDEFKQHQHIHYSSLRRSIKNPYIPIHNNPYSYQHIINVDCNEIEQIKQSLSLLSMEMFSSLCSKVHESNELTHCLILLLESGGLSLNSIPGAYSIALEAATNLVTNDGRTLAPIQSRPVATSLRKAMREEIRSPAYGLDVAALNILDKKINDINKPTNIAKLTSSFESHGITLGDNDKSEIFKRNDFLHGKVVADMTTIPFADNMYSEVDGLSMETRSTLYTTYRLYTLIAALILKYCGFGGRIINYPKIYEKFIGINLNEDYFRKI